MISAQRATHRVGDATSARPRDSLTYYSSVNESSRKPGTWDRTRRASRSLAGRPWAASRALVTMSSSSGSSYQGASGARRQRRALLRSIDSSRIRAKGVQQERNFSPTDVHSVCCVGGTAVDAARVGLFHLHLRLQLCTLHGDGPRVCSLAYAQQKTEMERKAQRVGAPAVPPTQTWMSSAASVARVKC